jgi:hypothetical protein
LIFVFHLECLGQVQVIVILLSVLLVVDHRT